MLWYVYEECNIKRVWGAFLETWGILRAGTRQCRQRARLLSGSWVISPVVGGCNQAVLSYAFTAPPSSQLCQASSSLPRPGPRPDTTDIDLTALLFSVWWNWETCWPQVSNSSESLCLCLKPNLLLVKSVCFWLLEWWLKSHLQQKLRCGDNNETVLHPAWSPPAGFPTEPSGCRSCFLPHPAKQSVNRRIKCSCFSSSAEKWHLFGPSRTFRSWTPSVLRV